MTDGTEVTVFSDLIGKSISVISTVVPGTEVIFFTLYDNSIWKMWYEDGAPVAATVAEVVGDIKDIMDSALLEAESISQKAKPEDIPEGYDPSATWTFYKFRTRKGSVVIRWLGISNGWYSEKVNFMRIGVDASRPS